MAAISTTSATRAKTTFAAASTISAVGKSVPSTAAATAATAAEHAAASWSLRHFTCCSACHHCQRGRRLRWLHDHGPEPRFNAGGAWK